MKNKKKVYITLVTILAVMLVSVIGLKLLKKDKGEENPEILVSKKYEQVNYGDEAIDGTEFVTFDAFYLRDLDGDGYAEKLRGTCREIGTQDTLYMDLNVLTNGTLKDAKITINGKNFYFATALVKDSVISKDYIGTNTREIRLNDVSSGTQKLIMGNVQSGNYNPESFDIHKADAIGNDTNKYTVKDNTVTLTGTHVADDGTETSITKTVNLINDWHGTTRTTLDSYYLNQEYSIENVLDETKENVNLKFKVNPEEINKQLIISNQHFEFEVPEFSGYKATAVTVDNNDAIVDYDSENKIAKIDLNASIDDKGIITKSVARDITYQVTIKYPYEAYEKADKEGFTLNIPIDATYTGYNNPNTEFTNPYVSNVAEQVISVLYGTPRGDVAVVYASVGKFIYVYDEELETYRNKRVISKEKPLNIYNNIENEDEEEKYSVLWEAYTGTQALNVPIILREPDINYTDKFLDTNANYTDMLEYIENIGIYFSNANGILGENGFINVYNDETNELLHTFTKDDWDKYDEENPYRYETPVKHIRVETSNVQKTSRLYVYNIKAIDDIKLTADYTEDEFEKLSEIYTYLEGSLKLENDELVRINYSSGYAKYEEPFSQARLNVYPYYINNQETAKNVKLNIKAESEEIVVRKWKNGEFLIKYPSEIIDVNINSVIPKDSSITITGVDTYEKNGNIYTKIYTSNENELDVEIVIDADITADPRKGTLSRDIELYYYNPSCSNYYDYSRAKDDYDINGNENVEEFVGYAKTNLNLMAPSGLLTSQTAINYNDAGEITIAPQIADIDKADETKNATINLNITNNYSGTISEVKIVGKIPFKGNTYQLNGKDIGSTFDTTMTDDGIIVPEELKPYATVYYSYNEKVTEDINAKENGWTTTPDDMSKVKNYLIDLGSYVMPVGSTADFSYDIKIPSGIDYNKISYSDHAIYYCLDTDQGKLKTQTEPNKLGFRIAEKYNLEITKLQKNTNKIVQGVVFSVQEVGIEDIKSATTDSNGIATIENLYVEKEYIVKEIKTNTSYILNNEEIKIIGHIVDGQLQIEILEGNFKDMPVIEVVENANTKVKVSLENEVKYNFELIKTQAGTNDVIEGVIFRLKGNDGIIKPLITDAQGKFNARLLKPNVQYTLTEIDSKGHYLKEPVSFMMVRDTDGNLKFNLLSGELDTLPVLDETGEIPVVRAGLSNKKIPTYSIRITKKETDTENVLAGTKFKLIGENKSDNVVYTTDENGVVQLDNLYEYVEGKEIKGEYTLQEVFPTEGYVLNNTPVQFKVQRDATGELKLEILGGAIRENVEDIQVDNTDPNNPIINITIDNEPVFTLTKVDAETGEPLEGVEFEIRDLDGNKVVDANGNAVDKVYTDSKGKIRLSLTHGLYQAIETKPLEGYAKPELYTGIGIGENKEATLEGNIEFSKNDLAFINFYGLTAVEDGVVAVGYDGEIVKYDFDGKLVWKNDEERNDKPYDVSTLEDGVVVATLNEDIKKYDSYGNLVWKSEQSIYGAYHLTIVEDGIIGVTQFGSVVKYDFDGNLIWENTENASFTVGNSSYDYQDVITIEDGIIGVTQHGLVAKYDFDGNLIWENKEKSYQYYGVTAVEDGVIAAGSAGRVVKYGLDGTIKWESAEKSIHIENITTVNDGLIAVATGGEVVKYDLDGKLVWENIEKGCSYNDVVTVKDGIITLSWNGVIAKYDFDGNIIWSNFRNAYDETTAISADDGIIIESRGIIAKLDFDGNLIWENAEKYESNYSISRKIKTIIVEDGIMMLKNSNELIKYDSFGEILFEKTLDFKYDEIKSIEDGFIAVASDGSVTVYDLNGNIVDDTIEYKYYGGTILEDGVISAGYNGSVTRYDFYGNIIWENTEKAYNYNVVTIVEDGIIAVARNGQVVKYSLDGKVMWENTEKTDLYCYLATSVKDGVIIVDSDGQVIKYDLDGKIVWENTEYEPFGYDSADFLEGGIVSLEDGVIIVGTNGKVIKYTEKIAEPQIVDSKDIVVKNEIAEYKITTKVNGGGGNISGKDENPYEVVKYKENSIKDIIATPVKGYKVQSISVNGKNIDFVENEDGTVILDKFISMTEDKEVIVTFAKISNSLTIKKIDSITKNPLENVKFNIKRIELREEPINEERIGDIVANGEEYYNVNYEDKIEGCLGNMIENGTYYFIANGNGGYESNNQGKDSTKSCSYMEIDLTSRTGIYRLVVNANISSQAYYDYGYATITSDITVPSKNFSDGRFIYINGTVAQKDYTTILEGGKKYYLHFVYDKDGYGAKGDDKFTINSVNLYGTTTVTYNFIDNGKGGYESNNKGEANTEAASYIPIDLTGCYGKYNLTVNANISSEKYYDTGKAAITTDTARPTNAIWLIDDNGTSESVTTPKDYNAIIEGGKMYYLHLMYKKDGAKDDGEDKFTINSINLSLYQDDFIEDTITTDKNGEARIELIDGKYQITELEAPEGYALNSRPMYYDFVSGQENTITIENDPIATVLVHHYIKDTTTSVADDENIKGGLGKEYTTSPKTDLKNYELVKNGDGSYQIPDNASGIFTEEPQVVTYYYELKPCELIVHHYLDGTEDSVAPDDTQQGLDGENYTTSPATPPILEDKYELVQDKLPENANGTFTDTLTEVTYYYKVKEYNITTEVEGGNGKISGESETPFETVQHGENSVKDIIVTPDVGYKIKNITVNGTEISFTLNEDGTYTLDKFTNMTEDKHIIVRFERKDSNAIITKIDKDTKLPLEGVEFKITDENGYIVRDIFGNEMMNLVTDENGNIKVNLPDGKYNAVETKTLRGYVLDTTPRSFEVKTVTKKAPEVDWQKDAVAYAGSVATDDGIITFGKYGEIAKLDENGDIIWQNDSYCASVCEKITKTESNNVIAVSDISIIKVSNEDGNNSFNDFGINTEIYDVTAIGEDAVIMDNEGTIARYTLDGKDEPITVWTNTDKSYPYTAICRVEDGVIAVSSDGQVVKYDLGGTFKWENTDKTYKYADVYALNDGIVAVSSEGQVVKYDLNGNFVWENTELTYNYITVNAVTDGIIAAGYDDKVAKYSFDGKLIWQANPIGDKAYVWSKDINSIIVYKDQLYFSTKHNAGLLIKLNEVDKVSQEESTTNITIENEYKEYNITTEVDGIGGTISGENENPYEVVLHNEDSVKDIVCTPDKDYKITSVTVNGTEIAFTPNADGTYTLPKFTNITEDKHVIVKYKKKDTSIIVKHVTEDGTDIIPPETIPGKIGDPYTTEPKDFAEYELKTTPDNANGNMTEEQITVIYVYSLVTGKVTVTKVDNKDNTKLLSGATFKLEKIDVSGNVDTSFTAIEKTTDETGKVEFTDLLVGKYQIVEIQAPNGYELANTISEVEITKENKNRNVTFKNRESFVLPMTGEIGTIIFTSIGVLLLIIATSIRKSKIHE